MATGETSAVALVATDNMDPGPATNPGRMAIEAKGWGKDCKKPTISKHFCQENRPAAHQGFSFTGKCGKVYEWVPVFASKSVGDL